MKQFMVAVFLFSFFCNGQTQKSKDEFYKSLLGKDSLVDYVLKNRDRFRLQFIITDIQRDEDGEEQFTTFDFSTGEYFYPASMVKLPTAIAMMEILDSLELSKDCYLKMNSDIACGNNAFAEMTQKRNIPIKLAIEDMLSISDNYFYSLFFHAATPKKINYTLTSKQLPNTKIYSSFSGCPRGKQVGTHSYSMFYPNGKLIYNHPKTFLDSVSYMNRLPYSKDKLIGKYQLENGKKVEKPYDFNYHLDYPLKDIHGTVFRLIFPQHLQSNERFDLNYESRKFLLKSMGNFPREMQNNTYHNSSNYPDNYYKYAIIGNKPEFASSGRYRTFSKIGIAYGFVTESAYIVDFENHKDFLFSVSIYVNNDDVVNDGTYEYEKIARPFIANFSRIIQQALSNPNPEQSLVAYDYFKFLQEIMNGN